MARKADYKLGRIIQHDPRSRMFAIEETDLSTLKSVRWERHAPVFDQGNTGSCTGNACLGAICTGDLYHSLEKFDINVPMDETHAVTIYSMATKIDEWPGEYPPEDTGSSGLAVAKVAKNIGYISGYSHAFTFNAALTALARGPVITGVNWYSSFFFPDATGECKISTRAKNNGGHEICMDEIDFENRRVWFTNSWGKSWGIDGRAWFSFDTWERLLGEQGDVTQFVPRQEAVTVVIPKLKFNFNCIFDFIKSLLRRIHNE